MPGVRFRRFGVWVATFAVASWLVAAPTGATPAAEHLLARPSCRLVRAPSALPLGLGQACPGVRPGAAVITPIGLCTFNFLWAGSDGRTYAGTAGHCILQDSDVAEARWPAGKGPPALDSTGRHVGEFAYAVLRDDADFALVRLDPGVTADPRVCQFGGPTGMNNDRTANPVALHEFGQGELLGVVVPGRTLFAFDGLSDPRVVDAVGLVSSGDSGAPVLGPDGRAVGVVVAGTSILGLPPLAGEVEITRLGPQVARASQVTGVTYTLRTAATG